MGDEGEVALGARRKATVKAVIAVGSSLGLAPLIKGEGRVSDHDLKLHRRISFDEFGTPKRVAPFDAGGVDVVQEHVHLR